MGFFFVQRQGQARTEELPLKNSEGTTGYWAAYRGELCQSLEEGQYKLKLVREKVFADISSIHY